jgi:thiamine-monophosphate kinase
MIDISDGLAADIQHICAESGCGAVLYAEAIPINEAAQQMNDGISPLDHALGDGEDFELVFAVSAMEARRLLQEQPLAGVVLVHVGEVLQERKLYLEEKGRRETLPARGYVHVL